MPTPKNPAAGTPKKISTGIVGLDDILSGGLAADRLYLIQGVPGSGKTTLAMNFLLEGARLGEPVLYITLSESEIELRQVAKSHGWSLDGVTIRELIPGEESLEPDEQFTMFHPSEIELSETTKTILADVERIKPMRVVFDSLSELKMLAGSPLRYRRQILALKQFFAGRQCTVLMLDDMSGDKDLHLESIAHAVIRLEQLYPEYGAERRRLIVLKYRGTSFRGGYHDYNIKRGGLEVYPRLVAAEHRSPAAQERFATGVNELDTLLGGGVESGTGTLITGAPGTGKSTIAAQIVAAAASRGKNAAIFLFEETIDTLLVRLDSLGINIKKHIKAGRVTVKAVAPGEISPGEFVHLIRESVEANNASVVMIDSLNGYLNAMPEERFLVIHLHELLTYLAQHNVATLLTSTHKSLIGSGMESPVDATYIADSVILTRYYEVKGEVRQAISVMKKRRGEHERTIRDFSLGKGGIKVGPPLREFRGVLTGVPVPVADEEQ